MRRAVLLLAAAGCLLAACSTGPARAPGSSGESSPAVSTPAPSSSSSSPSPSRTPTPTPTPPPESPARQYLARLSLAQKVGQLFMVDCPTSGVTAATRTAITRYAVGSVILDGNNSDGVEAIASLTGQLQHLAPNYLGLFVATDQEGGLVQRLRGPGFADIPAATEQGQVAPSQLQVQTTVWGGALRAAGVNVDLAPVMDVVPADFGSNPPIGDLDREFGSTPEVVATHGVAVVRGLAAAGVDATVKHFPGLGRVHGNTDTTTGVTDYVTTADDPFLAPFRAAILAKVPFVMVSTAVYQRIDPARPAAFSSRIVTGMLRHDLGFAGVVVSDDLGNAAAVRDYSVPDRALDFLAAGGDMVLTVDAAQIPAMTAAVIARARRDPAFLALVNAAALRVLTAKQHRGLLG